MAQVQSEMEQVTVEALKYTQHDCSWIHWVVFDLGSLQLKDEVSKLEEEVQTAQAENSKLQSSISALNVCAIQFGVEFLSC